MKAGNQLERLATIGFVRAGYWACKQDKLCVALDACQTAKNILYALVVNGEVMYIGKSVRTLASRMYGYRNPHTSQRTNFRNNEKIREALEMEKKVELYVLPDNGLLHYGGFHVNLAAGLEDSLIRKIQPAWNGAVRGAKTAAITVSEVKAKTKHNVTGRGNERGIPPRRG